MAQQDDTKLHPAIGGRQVWRLITDAPSGAVGRRRPGRNAPRYELQASSPRPPAPGYLVAALTFGLLANAASLALSTGAASAACQPAQEVGPAVTPGTESSAADMGSLTARVQVAGLPGVAPPPGLPTPAPQVLGPAAGTAVQIIDPLASEVVVAEQIADASGEVHFELPPGQYWVLVPWSDHVAGFPGAPTVATSLPDGRTALAWQTATVDAGGAPAVALTIDAALP